MPGCGDGIANRAVGEACDDAGETISCDIDCTLPACGDGRTNRAVGERCDDHNPTAGDGCSATCTVEPGYTYTGEPSVCVHT